MSGLSVLAFPEDRAAAQRLADALSAPLAVLDVHVFPDGETLPTVPAGLASTVILYRRLDHPDRRLIPLLLAADAARRAGARRLVLVAPYLPYLRQDTVFAPGQPVSRDAIGQVLGGAFDRIVTVNAHLHRTRDLAEVFGHPVDNLDVASPLARRLAGGAAPLVVGPDIESAPWVQSAARAVGGEAMTFLKTREGDREVTLTLAEPERVRGCRVLLLDDICSTGATLEAAIRQLLAAGAARVDVGVIHALFTGPTLDRLAAAGAARIASSDSIPHPTNALELAPSLALALQDEAAR
ncbi:ribose-phosphate pyrophosphokinase [Caulobacter ginsengisoli]|uniref:Ribose-phosphate pyrophosphokinase n=1 Tax=Caulobacter ginsengisoli TaxID=400775 RepID=A0ABU0IVC8_9CAUL|nr:ribose-phosphate diphosphokinase [Caulobacter ginsengisoli]MDQ0465971.1 ribose-phosphate pyrophosphokinase [Caulobacter ginsengisoli]